MGYFTKLRILLTGILLLVLHAQSWAGETNFWPFFVQQTDSPYARPDHIGSMGPIFSETLRGETRILSIRPLWTTFQYGDTGVSSTHFVYPFINWTDTGEIKYLNTLNLIKYQRNDQSEETFFQIFPFVFSLQSPKPEVSYFAFWPIGGVLKNRFWRDEISFALWPLYVRTQKGDETWTHFPYPFLRTLSGPKSSGFAIWPLYGRAQRENDYTQTMALWPIYYHYREDLDEAVPYVRFAILPFYHRETAAGLKSESFVWPFFGYTRERDPLPEYSEIRYFWPFLVQGRGEERYVNRWMPLYTNEREPGNRKKWYLWPVLRREVFEEPGLTRERDSFLYFIFREERQHFAGTTARLTFLWPFFSYWHDGYDRKQLQALDPLSVFFPTNEKVRENWTPLFALYRYDERMDNARHSVLWDFVVWEKDDSGMKAFYAGPLFEWERGSHWEVLKGLVGRAKTESDGHRRLKLFWKR
jgi:hypothetical protein